MTKLSKNFWHNPLVFIIFTLIFVITLFSWKNNQQQQSIEEKQISLLEQDINELENNLEEKQQQKDNKYAELIKEKIIRDELLLKKENEYIVQLPNIEIEDKKRPIIITPKPLQVWKKRIFNN